MAKYQNTLNSLLLDCGHVWPLTACSFQRHPACPQTTPDPLTPRTPWLPRAPSSRLMGTWLPKNDVSKKKKKIKMWKQGLFLSPQITGQTGEKSINARNVAESLHKIYSFTPSINASRSNLQMFINLQNMEGRETLFPFNTKGRLEGRTQPRPRRSPHTTSLSSAV